MQTRWWIEEITGVFEDYQDMGDNFGLERILMIISV
jgi:hypothetical protein